jgi:hypothetical protein
LAGARHGGTLPSGGGGMEQVGWGEQGPATDEQEERGGAGTGKSSRTGAQEQYDVRSKKLVSQDKIGILCGW